MIQPILLSKCLRDLGFVRTMCESEIWIQKSSSGLFYEYIGTFVDDLCLVMENPQEFLKKVDCAPYHLRSKFNLSVILSKQWGYQNSYDLLLNPIFHHIGNVGFPSLIMIFLDTMTIEIRSCETSYRVYLQQKMGSVETRKLLFTQS